MSKVFWVSSTVRSINTRLTRSLAPERARFKQFILGGSTRLVRNRPLMISDTQLKHYHEELEAKWQNGLIEVREGSPDGQVYKFEKKQRRKKSTPPPPPPPEPEVVVAPEPEPEVVEEPPVEKEEEAVADEVEEEFVPLEEPGAKRRGRKPKKE